ncbi:MAG: hypothetical protein CR988_00315 [Treponema sp.]|nr:MAG: hypothetical protein CR988_00315 [Treponema sp.]
MFHKFFSQIVKTILVLNCISVTPPPIRENFNELNQAASLLADSSLKFHNLKLIPATIKNLPAYKLLLKVNYFCLTHIYFHFLNKATNSRFKIFLTQQKLQIVIYENSIVYYEEYKIDSARGFDACLRFKTNNIYISYGNVLKLIFA